jgi:hypothetical protein
MPLQKLPSLPPETLPDQSTTAKSYYRKLVKYAYHQTREHDKVELTASTIVAVGAAFIGGFTSGSVLSGIVAAAVTFVAMLIVIFGVQLAFAPRALYQAKEGEIAVLKAERDKLEEMLQPKFEILYGEAYPFTEDTGEYKFHRIGLKNIGNSTVHGVAVKMDGFTSGRTYNSLPLRAMNVPPHTRFSIDPGATAYIDVVKTTLDAKQLVMLSLSIFETRQTIVYEGSYHLTFRATASDSRSCERKAILDVDSYGRVFIKPDDDQSVQKVGSTPSS